METERGTGMANQVVSTVRHTGWLLAMAAGAMIAATGAAPAQDDPAGVDLTVDVSVVADGSAPWSDTDDGPHNGLVRRGDEVTYQVAVTAAGGTAHDVTVSLDATPAWAAETLTLTCPTAGSDAAADDGDTAASCPLGDVRTEAVLPVTVAIPEQTDMGSTVRVWASTDADELDEVLVSEPAVTTVVAAHRTPSPTASSSPPPSTTEPPNPPARSSDGPAASPTRTTSPVAPGTQSGDPRAATTSSRPGGSGSTRERSSRVSAPGGLRPSAAALPRTGVASTVPDPRVASPPRTATSPPGTARNAAGAVAGTLPADAFVAAVIVVGALAFARRLARMIRRPGGR